MADRIVNGAASAIPSPFNMAEDVLDAATRKPGKVALEVLHRGGAEIWTYAELEQAVRGAATGLRETGVRPGERVLLRLGNTPVFPVAYLASICVGLVPVATSPLLTLNEVEKIVSQLEPSVIIWEPGIACAPCPRAEWIESSDLLEMRSQAPADYLRGDPDRLAYIVYTSGTSGKPQAVCHAHRAVRARRMMWHGWYGLHETDRLLHAGAFNWTFTLGTGLIDPWTIGATALIPAPETSPESLPRLIEASGATIFAAAPGIYRRMLRDAGAIDAPALRHGLSAGEKLPDAIRAAWRVQTGREIHEAFGMSECSTFISGSPERPAPPGTLGYAQPGRRLAVFDEAGRPAALGAAGTLAVHSADPGLMLGYWGDAAATRARYSGDWFLTGDTVALDENGAFTYQGRDDDMMNAGGVRVSPIEVEEVVAAFPAIGDCAVTEVSIDTATSVIAAFYTATEEIPAAELHDFASARLARYKQPRLYRRVASVPRTANGKISRRALRRLFEDENGQA